MQNALTIRPYKLSLGAWVEHCDLSQQQSAADRALLNQALIDHGVLFFRGQHLSPAEQLAAAWIFGEPLRKNIYLDAHPEQPEIEVIEHSGKTGSGRTDNWHIDVSWQPPPPRPLYCMQWKYQTMAAGTRCGSLPPVPMLGTR